MAAFFNNSSCGFITHDRGVELVSHSRKMRFEKRTHFAQEPGVVLGEADIFAQLVDELTWVDLIISSR